MSVKFSNGDVIEKADYGPTGFRIGWNGEYAIVSEIIGRTLILSDGQWVDSRDYRHVPNHLRTFARASVK